VAGGLARWVSRGQKLERSWLDQTSLAEVQREEMERQGRWARAVQMYTKVEDLIGDKV